MSEHIRFNTKLFQQYEQTKKEQLLSGFNHLYQGNTKVFYIKDYIPDPNNVGKNDEGKFDNDLELPKEDLNFELVRFFIPKEFKLCTVIDKDWGGNKTNRIFVKEHEKVGSYNGGKDLWGYFAFNFRPETFRPELFRDTAGDIIMEYLKKKLPGIPFGRSFATFHGSLPSASENQSTDAIEDNESVTNGFYRESGTTGSNCPQLLYCGVKHRCIPVFKFRKFYFMPTISMSESICFFAMEHKSALYRIFNHTTQHEDFMPVNPNVRGLGTLEDIRSESILGIDIYKNAMLVDNNFNEIR